MWRAVVAQPLNSRCCIKPLGKIDTAAGEFWVENPFLLASTGLNLSAFERSRLFLNVQGKAFIDASYLSAADIDSDSRSVMVADFDGDGRPDILVGTVGGGPLRLFLNRFPRRNAWIRLNLVGVESNRPGIGARIVAHCGGRRIFRDVFPANGFSGQGPTELLLGVGPVERVERLSIRWPAGRSQEFTNLPVNRSITITEGRADFATAPLAVPAPTSSGLVQKK
jgi:hypothetical protein